LSICFSLSAISPTKKLRRYLELVAKLTGAKAGNE
jgi:hypothetical protein